MKTLHRKIMRFQWLALLLGPALALPAPATPEAFDFKDPKNGNKIEFKLDAPAEKIAGTANDISGTVTFDPQNPGATRGKIAVNTASLTVPNALQTTTMRGSLWLDAAKYPQITFEAKELKNVQTNAASTTADVVGTFTLHGVSKELTIPVEMKYLKDKLGDRLGGTKRATFWSSPPPTSASAAPISTLCPARIWTRWRTPSV